MIYLDTSALVKRFVAEAGTPEVQRLVASEDHLSTSKIAYAEMYSGFTRKFRENEISKQDYELACSQFEADWDAYLRIELHDEILDISRRLIQTYPLRGFDAIHLASAIHLEKSVELRIRFVAADKRLVDAAKGEGITSINPLDIDLQSQA